MSFPPFTTRPGSSQLSIAAPLLLAFLYWALILSPTAAYAEPLVFNAAPAGIKRYPAPNIVISVDDSTAMNKPTIGIAELKAALKNVFLQDHPIRLAWQSMNGCRGFSQLINQNCTAPNIIRRWDRQHRVNFHSWVNALKAGGGTPGHLMVHNAGKHFYRNDNDDKNTDPWAFHPGSQFKPELTCRRVFHIYISGSAYNSPWNGTGPQIDASDESGARLYAQTPHSDYSLKPGIGNIDGDFVIVPGQWYWSYVFWSNWYSLAWATGAFYYPDWIYPLFYNDRPSILTGRNWESRQYRSDSVESLLYSDAWGFGLPEFGHSTLSDLAMGYYTYLRLEWDPSFYYEYAVAYNEMYARNHPVQSDENFGTAQKPAWLNPVSNPRNDPVRQARMVHYTVGMGDAASWNGPPYWQGDTYSGLAPLIRGEVEWPSPFCNGNDPCDGVSNYNKRANERKTELWHMALNSRGKFFPAPTASALESALTKTLADIQARTSGSYFSPVDSTSITTNGSRVRGNELVYIAGYDTKDASWSGKLSGHAIDASTLAISPTPTWEAHKILDSVSDVLTLSGRMVLTTLNGTSTTRFAWSSLDAVSKNAFQDAGTPLQAEQRMRYIVGDRSLEQANGGFLRNRNSRLGNIVNSRPWVTSKPQRLTFEHHQHRAFRTAQASRPTMLYVGANDGMLHGFNAANGNEVFAYIPRAAYSSFLYDYTLPSYLHRYTVDGSPFTGDADLSLRKESTATNANWRTVLVSGMGAGARGYFMLDVTNPTTNTSTMVLLDKTMPPNTTATHTADDDIGHIFAQPVADQSNENLSAQIVKMNNGRWAVVMGNGYNSINERPVLLVQYLDGDKALTRIVAQEKDASAPNGLSAPRLIDINSDGKMDIAYAGDLLGQLWKFDLSSDNEANWAVVNNKPLFAARDSFGTKQEITTAPVWMAPPQGGIQIAFGTGTNNRHFLSDRWSWWYDQTIYSILDDGTYLISNDNKISVHTDTSPINGRADLVRQVIANQVNSSTPNAIKFFNTSKNDVNYSGQNKKRGWYMDVSYDYAQVVDNPVIYEGQKILIYSRFIQHPGDEEICYGIMDTQGTDPDKNYVTVLNMFSGQPSQTPLFSQTGTDLSSASIANISLGTMALLRTNSGIELISPHNGSCQRGELCPSNFKASTANNLPGQNADWRDVR